jgi:hypothetical protein
MALFIVSLYLIEMIEIGKKWIIPSIIVIASLWLVQPTKPIKFLLLYSVYIIIKCIAERKIKWDVILSILGGYILSFIWWYNHFSGIIPKKASTAFASINAVNQNIIVGFFSALQKSFPASSGTGTRAYTWSEIIFAQHGNQINNPIGIGIFISLLILIGIIAVVIDYKNLMKKENAWKLIILLWTIITFLGFNTLTFNLPFGFFSFRWWMIFALPASILSSYGLMSIINVMPKYKHLIIGLVLIAILLTSAHQKYSVNTATWFPGLGWEDFNLQDLGSMAGYLWINQNLAQNTHIFAFTQSSFLLGFDMYSCEWCEKDQQFSKKWLSQKPEEINNFLKTNDYPYLIIDYRTAKEFGFNETSLKINELVASAKFKNIRSGNGYIIFEVN